MTETGNDKVTLGRLEAKIDAMRDDVRDLCQMMADHEKRIRDNREQLIAHGQRIGMFQAAQTTLTLIVGTVATWLGTR